MQTGSTQQKVHAYLLEHGSMTPQSLAARADLQNQGLSVRQITGSLGALEANGWVRKIADGKVRAFKNQHRDLIHTGNNGPKPKSKTGKKRRAIVSKTPKVGNVTIATKRKRDKSGVQLMTTTYEVDAKDVRTVSDPTPYPPKRGKSKTNARVKDTTGLPMMSPHRDFDPLDDLPDPAITPARVRDLKPPVILIIRKLPGGKFMIRYGTTKMEVDQLISMVELYGLEGVHVVHRNSSAKD